MSHTRIYKGYVTTILSKILIRMHLQEENSNDVLVWILVNVFYPRTNSYIAYIFIYELIDIICINSINRRILNQIENKYPQSIRYIGIFTRSLHKSIKTFKR